MKLLIFLLFFQFFIPLQISGLKIKLNQILASEISSDVDVSSSYEERYQKWLRQRQLKAEPKQKDPQSQAEVKAIRLPTTLPLKSEKISQETSPVTQEKSSVETKPRNTKQDSLKNKMAVDAVEGLLTQIPKDNKQVQSLLTMVNHTKVYFSINDNAPLKDLFTDERFKEIYTEEMKPETRKLTYYFFKGYQDNQRPPGEPVKKKLNRDTRITREKIESYLETTGIKSKLTRSLTGSYPKVIKPVIPDSDVPDTSAGAYSSESTEE